MWGVFCPQNGWFFKEGLTPSSPTCDAGSSDGYQRREIVLAKVRLATRQLRAPRTTLRLPGALNCRQPASTSNNKAFCQPDREQRENDKQKRSEEDRDGKTMLAMPFRSPRIFSPSGSAN